jgi:hypothetical protein
MPTTDDYKNSPAYAAMMRDAQNDSPERAASVAWTFRNIPTPEEKRAREWADGVRGATEIEERRPWLFDCSEGA